jgi:excisionase family DNA binding protein
MTTPDPLLVSVREAARRLGIGRDACYALVKEGRLGHLKVGRRVRVPVAALERFIDSELGRTREVAAP